MKGTGQKKDIGPEDDFPLMLDCKHRPRSSWRLMTWFQALEDAASLESHATWPVLCFKEPRTSVEYAMVRQGPLVKFIMHQARNMPPEMFILREGGAMKKSSLIEHWKIICAKAKKKRKKGGLGEPEEIIPMVRLYDKRRRLDLLVLSPEDLAKIFFAGGLLKKEKSNA